MDGTSAPPSFCVLMGRRPLLVGDLFHLQELVAVPVVLTVRIPSLGTHAAELSHCAAHKLRVVPIAGDVERDRVLVGSRPVLSLVIGTAEGGAEF